MADTLTITYAHYCDAAVCSRRGEQYVDRPRCNDGVAFIERPTCITSGAQLVEIRREAH